MVRDCVRSGGLADVWDKCPAFALLIPLILPFYTEFLSICGISARLLLFSIPQISPFFTEILLSCGISV